MFRAPLPRASDSPASEPLGPAIAHAARTVGWRTLIACVAVGIIGAVAGWFAPAHRVLLVSAAIALGAFGSGGIADRIVADERGSGNPDRVLVVGFLTIRGLSVVVGACAGVVSVAWFFFDFLVRMH